MFNVLSSFSVQCLVHYCCFVARFRIPKATHQKMDLVVHVKTCPLEIAVRLLKKV